MNTGRSVLLTGCLLGASCSRDDATLRISAQASSLASRALASDRAYRTLASLCDDVGNRLIGSPGFDRALQWAQNAMSQAGLHNVHIEKFLAPHWVRNHESARMLLPTPQDLSIVGLGLSVPTPKGGVTADVVVVSGLEELAALPAEKVKGRIVLFEFPFTRYGPAAKVRRAGPSAASRKGAVAVLVRSLTSRSLDTPHTGILHYDADAPAIPAAAVSVENAAMMRRMWAKGQRIRVTLEMACQTLPDTEVANVVGDLPGRSKPAEIILVGGHLDSWDVGQGAQDDGVGCVLSLEAARLIRDEGLRPSRTLRVVLFASEEYGGQGGEAYAREHRSELGNHAAVIETDSGNGLANGFSLTLAGAATTQAGKVLARMRRALGPVLVPLGAASLFSGGCGTDVEPMINLGVVGLEMSHDTTHFWEVQHSKADTFDKINEAALRKNAAILAVAAYTLAEMPERLLDGKSD